MFLPFCSAAMLPSVAEQAVMAAKLRCTVGQDCSHGPLSSCSYTGEPEVLALSLSTFGSATLGWARGKGRVGCSSLAVLWWRVQSLHHWIQLLLSGLVWHGAAGYLVGELIPFPRSSSLREILLWDLASISHLIFCFIRRMSCQHQMT